MATEVGGKIGRGRPVAAVGASGAVSTRKKRKRRGLTFLVTALIVLAVAGGAATGWVLTTTGEIVYPWELIWQGATRGTAAGGTAPDETARGDTVAREGGPTSSLPVASRQLPALPAVEEVLPLLAQRGARETAHPSTLPVGRTNPFQPVFGIESVPPSEVLPAPGAPVPGSPAPEGRKPLQVVLRILDPCWLEVDVDGQQVLRSNVGKDALLKYEADRRVTLKRVGRDRALSLSVNGQNLGRASSVAAEVLEKPKRIETEGRVVEISLARRYASGVLYDLDFTLLQ